MISTHTTGRSITTTLAISNKMATINVIIVYEFIVRAVCMASTAMLADVLPMALAPLSTKPLSYYSYYKGTLLLEDVPLKELFPDHIKDPLLLAPVIYVYDTSVETAVQALYTIFFCLSDLYGRPVDGDDEVASASANYPFLPPLRLRIVHPVMPQMSAYFQFLPLTTTFHMFDSYQHMHNVPKSPEKFITFLKELGFFDGYSCMYPPNSTSFWITTGGPRSYKQEVSKYLKAHTSYPNVMIRRQKDMM